MLILKNIVNYTAKRNIVIMSNEIRDMRMKYRNKTEAFLEKHIPVKNPFKFFNIWFEEVKKIPEILEPNAMCLATATRDGKPSCRFVLCKGYGENGFEFFTHYTSRKGLELAENPNASLCFYWEIINRSVRIEGQVEKLPIEEADNYFHRRPFNSQIGASLATQSQPVPSREALLEKEKELHTKYDNEQKVPRPVQWGGYVLRPNVIEFWQGQTDRIHDRIRFRKPKSGEEIDNLLVHQGEDGWVYERLAP